MNKEEDRSLNQRYLFSDEILFEEGIKACQQETFRRYKSGNYNIFDDNKDLLDKYINWRRQSNEIALFTLYAYADLSIHVRFNCLFNINDPTEHTISELTVTQCIYEGFYPTNTIYDGHKHTLICEFKDGIIPDIVNKLYVGITHKSPNLSKNRFMMGICDYANLQYISEQFNKVKALKEEYGDKWREHDL